MTGRERLAEMIAECITIWECSFAEDKRPTCEELADYLLARGVIAPPCKVGDRLFYIDKYTGTVEVDCVKYITVTRNDICPILKYHNTNFWKVYSWGKTVFLAREEAEAALAERRRTQ